VVHRWVRGMAEASLVVMRGQVVTVGGRASAKVAEMGIIDLGSGSHSEFISKTETHFGRLRISSN